MRVTFLIGISLAVLAVLASARAQDGEVLPKLEGMQGLVILCDDFDKLHLVKTYETVPGFDFLKITYNTIDVLVIADQVEAFKNFLEAHEIPYIVTDKNVEERVLENYLAQEIGKKAHALLQGGAATERLPFTYYPEYEEIVENLEYMASTYSDVAQLIDAGKSFEGRSLKGLKLSTGSGGKKPAIFIDGGIHAREWIASATALYILDQLVANATNRHMLEAVDWYILPLINPDGYQFTHEKYANRLWRKTRSVNRGSDCRGVDGNRNFDMAWMVVGASAKPCADTFAGAKPASEPETQAVQNFILARKGDIKVYLTLHSYGQYILYPWGYTYDVPKNEPQLRELAAESARAIAGVRKTRYTYGTSSNHLYPSSGGSDDWAMAKGGADLAYTYELPGGIHGFLLPPSEIIPVGKETFEAIKVIHKHVAANY